MSSEHQSTFEIGTQVSLNGTYTTTQDKLSAIDAVTSQDIIGVSITTHYY